MHASRIGAAFLGLLSLSACSLPKDSVEQQYDAEVRKLDLIPVYPPREDFQVGDVYLEIARKLKPGEIAGPLDSEEIRVGNIAEVFSDAQKNLNGRVSFSDTTVTGTALDIKQLDLPKGRLELSAGAATNVPLPAVAFPSISADAGTNFGWANVGPAFLGGLFSSNRTTVTVDFGDVRSYAASKFRVAADLSGQIEKMMPPKRPEECRRAVKLLFERFQDKRRRAGDDPSKPIDVVLDYKVVTLDYLTREINFSYQNASILALAKQSAAVAGTGGASYGPTVVVGTTTTTDAAATATSALTALQKQNVSGLDAAFFDAR